MTDHVIDIDATIDNYIAVWNETDPDRRRALIAAAWTDDGRYADPLLSGDGHVGLDAMVAGFQRGMPGLRFRRTGAFDAHHDRVRFGWEVGPADGPPLAGGVDFAELADGRLRSVTGFFDFAPAPANG